MYELKIFIGAVILGVFLNSVFAETTFFEGNYQEDFFIQKNFSEKLIFENVSYCGDGVCDSDETCEICVVDCGECEEIPKGVLINEGEVLYEKISQESEISESLNFGLETIDYILFLEILLIVLLIIKFDGEKK